MSKPQDSGVAECQNLALDIVALVSCCIIDGKFLTPAEDALFHVQIHNRSPDIGIMLFILYYVTAPKSIKSLLC